MHSPLWCPVIGQEVATDPALSEGVELDDLRSPFQLQLFSENKTRHACFCQSRQHLPFFHPIELHHARNRQVSILFQYPLSTLLILYVSLLQASEVPNYGISEVHISAVPSTSRIHPLAILYPHLPPADHCSALEVGQQRH